MSSGVKPTDACLKTYDELKLGKKHKYIIYGLVDNNRSIDVITTGAATKGGESDDDYEEFIAKLPEKECRWAIYDMEYDQGEGKRNKICFVAWTPDESPIKQRMVSASSKDALRRQLVGIAAEIQATSYDEVTKEAVLEKCQRR